MSKTIPLSKGYVAVVDDQDYDSLSRWNWCVLIHPKTPTPYAMRKGGSDAAGPSTVFMHREIMGAPDGVQVDHISGDGLDNRRENLRLCEPRENSRNRRKLKPGTSQYKGVVYRKRNDVWRARIRVDGELTHIGDYADEKDAALAYDAKARQLHGEFCRLNFPDVEDAKPVTVGDARRARSNAPYVGVGYIAKLGKWRARITVDGEHHNLGLFGSPEAAARAYDRAALEMRENPSRLNFPKAA